MPTRYSVRHRCRSVGDITCASEVSGRCYGVWCAPLPPSPPTHLASFSATLSRPLTRTAALRQLIRVLRPYKASRTALEPATAQRLAEIFAASSFPEGARHVLSFAPHNRHQPQRAYLRAGRPTAGSFQMLVAHSERALSCKAPELATTRRLLNWRVRSLIETKHFSLLDKVLEDFADAGVLPNRLYPSYAAPGAHLEQQF